MLKIIQNKFLLYFNLIFFCNYFSSFYFTIFYFFQTYWIISFLNKISQQRTSWQDILAILFRRQEYFIVARSRKERVHLRIPWKAVDRVKNLFKFLILRKINGIWLLYYKNNQIIHDESVKIKSNIMRTFVYIKINFGQ